MAADTNDGSTLEQRLRVIEDRLEIYNVIASIRRAPIPVPEITPPRCGPRTTRRFRTSATNCISLPLAPVGTGSRTG